MDPLLDIGCKRMSNALKDFSNKAYIRTLGVPQVYDMPSSLTRAYKKLGATAENWNVQ